MATTCTGSEMRPTEGGRYVVVRRTPDGTDDRCHATAVQRPDKGARVRWRRICGRRRHRVLLELRRPAPLPSGSAARSPTPITPGSRPALRGRRPRPPPRTADLRARGPQDRPRSGEHDCSRRCRRSSPGRRPRGRQRLLLLAAPQPGRLAPGMAHLESSQHALGRDRALGRRRSRTTAPSPGRSWSPAGSTSRSSSRSGRRTAFCISSPTGAGGGTCTAGATGGSSLLWRWRPSSGGRSGSSACPPTPSSRRAASSAPSGGGAPGSSRAWRRRAAGHGSPSRPRTPRSWASERLRGGSCSSPARRRRSCPSCSWMSPRHGSRCCAPRATLRWTHDTFRARSPSSSRPRTD